MNKSKSKPIVHAGGEIAAQIPQRPEASAVRWNDEQMKVITGLIAPKCTTVELALFGEVCRKSGLDPFSRQIYAIKRKGGMTIQTSIDGFRAIAEDSGEYAGNDDPLYNGNLTLADHIAKTGNPKTAPITATVSVYRIVNGERCAFTASAAFEQYATKSDRYDNLWSTMPHTMIAKCAEALALRKAFPRKLSGLYTGDEMKQAEIAEPTTAYDHPSSLLPAEHDAQPATPAQVEFIERMIKSHHFDPERAAINGRLKRGMTKSEATKCLNFLEKEKEKRAAVEDFVADHAAIDPDAILDAIDPDAELITGEGAIG